MRAHEEVLAGSGRHDRRPPVNRHENRSGRAEADAQEGRHILVADQRDRVIGNQKRPALELDQPPGPSHEDLISRLHRLGHVHDVLVDRQLCGVAVEVRHGLPHLFHVLVRYRPSLLLFQMAPDLRLTAHGDEDLAEMVGHLVLRCARSRDPSVLCRDPLRNDRPLLDLQGPDSLGDLADDLGCLALQIGQQVLYGVVELAVFTLHRIEVTMHGDIRDADLAPLAPIKRHTDDLLPISEAPQEKARHRVMATLQLRLTRGLAHDLTIRAPPGNSVLPTQVDPSGSRTRRRTANSHQMWSTRYARPSPPPPSRTWPCRLTPAVS